MPPNFANAAPSIDAEMAKTEIINEQKTAHNVTENMSQDYLSVFQSSVNTFAHILIGATVGINCFFAFRNGLPLSATGVHIVLCVIGYQLLMAQAILSLADSNSWSANLNLRQRRRVHWVMQILGSGMAIIGSVYKMIDKEVNFTSTHGKLGFAAMIFTILSFMNGVASLYSYELRKYISGNISKASHICFGTVAFVLASVCLCYGNNKGFFRNWATNGLAYTIMCFTGIFTFIVIINPVFTFYKRSYIVIKN